jgi:hypothetical protein
MYEYRRTFAKRMVVITLCLVMAIIFVLPPAAHAQETGKTVRVGWYESPFNMTDQFGRRSGYAYDYQKKSLLTPAGIMSMLREAGRSCFRCSLMVRSI